MTSAAPPRIASLDIVRGVAVMGILAMNVVSFAMPYAAYTNPAAWGGDTADLVAWALGFVFANGKMRGLFSLLFGASMLLVIERAEAAGELSERVHFRRMAWLLVLGLAHFYLIWWGDILSLYAPAGMIAWFFWTQPVRALIGWAAALLAVQFALFAGLAATYFEAAASAAAGSAADVEAVATWQSLREEFAPAAAEFAREVALHRGGYAEILEHRVSEYLWDPLTTFLFYGPETVGYMLLGMAALKTGFIAGAWSDAAYRRAAGWTLALTLPIYALLAASIWSSGFDVRALVAWSLAAPIPLRPLTVLGYVALIILAFRRSGWLAERVAAAGRAAFTNYVGTSIVMTTLFYGYGFGLFGHLGRAELWLVVIPAWALMLIWSKPWLDRYRYGPLEWLWRSLARGSPQPMRRS